MTLSRKTFVFLFALFLIIVNWSIISPLFFYFDWRFVEAKVSGFLPDMSLIESKFFVSFKEEPKQAFLSIPRIEISAPIIFAAAGRGREKEEIEKLLAKGVVHFSGSALPGEKGKTVILGHSAPAGWPKINYDWVFSDLDKLSKGDEVVVSYNDSSYAYSVVEKNIFSPKQAEQFFGLSSSEKPLLILSTCWPPGKDFKRLIVLTELDRTN